MATFGAVDFPADGETVAGEGFLVQGFAFDEKSGPFTGIVALCEGVEIGSTTLRQRRPDLPGAISRIRDIQCGYRLVATLPVGSQGPQVVDICAFFKSGASWVQRVHVIAGATDYRQSPYGTLLHSTLPNVYRRNDIYSSGPPSPTASVECAALLESYLAPGERVIDVGCGLGAYGPRLLSHGVNWQGCEIRSEFVDQLRERGLPVTLVDDPRLPFETDAFDTAICIEVLEHIEDCDAFLTEIRRIVGKRALFSVPNAEAIPVLADRLVVPWHLLEADHKNFFTRGGLRATLERHFRHVEVGPYGVMPIQSSNGTSVYYHLFAVAEC